MVDQTTDTAESPEAVTSIFHLDDRDWMLALLVNMANHGVGIGITLQVRGVSVSGELASGGAYLKWMSSEMTKAAKGAFPTADFNLGEVVPSADEIYGDQSDSLYKTMPMYLHVRNAKIHAPGQPPLNGRGVWWRGRLSEVSGFFLGELQPSA